MATPSRGRRRDRLVLLGCDVCIHVYWYFLGMVGMCRERWATRQVFLADGGLALVGRAVDMQDMMKATIFFLNPCCRYGCSRPDPSISSAY